MPHQRLLLQLGDRSSSNGLASSRMRSFVRTNPSRFSIRAATDLFLVSKSVLSGHLTILTQRLPAETLCPL